MKTESQNRIAKAWSTIIRELNYDQQDPHLVDSPERIARFFADWHQAGKEPPALTTFPNDPRVDELVAVGSIRFYSLCAHHGLPFFGHAAIGYIPGLRVLGLSKFARAVDFFAHRFQTQERLTHQIASFLEEALEPVAIGVVLRAEHMCMSMRGPERPCHATITSDMRRAFRTKPEARAELLALVRT